MEHSNTAQTGTASAPQTGRLVVIGNLDGVHRGHQAVLRDAAKDAKQRGLDLLVLTFHPHPAKVLRQTEPPVLTTMSRKLELIARVVPEATIAVETFDLTWASQSPEDFATNMLVTRYNAKLVVVGHNFRFGKNRSGDLPTLTKIGEVLGFETRSHPLVGDEQGTWSSSRIRVSVARGDMEEAARMLGRPHMLSGTVVEGDKRGRTIGFPTCNVAGVEQTLPAWGVYAVLVDRVGENGRATALAKAVANIGVRPTVKASGAVPVMEVHLFDFDGDLYGATLRVHLIKRLREERRFPGIDELKAQIATDASGARERLASEVPDPEAGGGWR